MTDMETEGYEWMKGALRFVCELGLKLVLLVLLANIIRTVFSLGVDDSDASGWSRSGFRVMKDSKTGVEYLSDGKGGLIRRAENPALPINGHILKK